MGGMELTKCLFRNTKNGEISFCLKQDFFFAKQRKIIIPCLKGKKDGENPQKKKKKQNKATKLTFNASFIEFFHVFFLFYLR